jgi:hypothetical protein
MEAEKEQMKFRWIGEQPLGCSFFMRFLGGVEY